MRRGIHLSHVTEKRQSRRCFSFRGKKPTGAVLSKSYRVLGEDLGGAERRQSVVDETLIL